jgi:hydroxypyruvate reductase
VSDDRTILLDLYRTAVEAAAPAPALAAALTHVPISTAERIWVLSLGKAAAPLAAEAVAQLRARGQDPAGGLIVAPEASTSPHPAITTAIGDHPLPGPQSVEAADAVERTVREVGLGDEVWVLLSGGTSSLVGSPVRGLDLDDLRTTYDVLLRSGVDIVQMNRIRKRFSRWSGGRLAQVLAHARVRVFVVSDVFGDDVSIVGSGPFSPDATNAAHIRALITEAGIEADLPRSIMDFVDRTERGMIPETPKPGDAAFRDVSATIIANSDIAIEAAAARAYDMGFAPRIRRKPVRGEAARAGEKMARRMLEEDLSYEPDEGSEPFVLLCASPPPAATR